MSGVRVGGCDGIRERNEVDKELLLGLEHHTLYGFAFRRCPRLEFLHKLVDGLDACLIELAVMKGE